MFDENIIKDKSMLSTYFIRFTIVYCCIIFGIVTTAFAEQTDSLLQSFNMERISIQQKGMQTLGLWALSNIAIGTYASFSTSGERKAFWQMNAGWNIINAGIAGLGYFNQTMPNSLSGTIHEQQSIETILAVNAGLDIAYILGGLYLTEKSKTSEQSELLRGFGNAIMLQGAFLFVFDAVLFAVNAHHGKDLHNILQSVNISQQGIGFNITF
jgi:hypothetical protein